MLRAADLLEAAHAAPDGPADARSGQDASNAVAEVREAVDFCATTPPRCKAPSTTPPHPAGPGGLHQPLELPLAIFTGQVAAALAARQPVLAKAGRANPLIAAQAWCACCGGRRARCGACNCCRAGRNRGRAPDWRPA